jgi:hypothetical protein
MPCRVDTCPGCGRADVCECSLELKKFNESKGTSFDVEGALCDLLTLIENEPKDYFSHIDPKTLKWWKSHEKREENKIKKEALAKLTLRERRLLGLK